MDEFLASLIWVAIPALVLVGYSVRTRISGRLRFERIERERGSFLLGRTVMEAGYWAMQPVARALIRCGVSPDAISWCSLVLGLLSGIRLAEGYFGSGALLFALSGLCDALDGMVARATGVASDGGEVLDAVVDRYSEFFFLGGLAWYYRPIPEAQLLCWLALLGSFMVSYSSARAEVLGIELPRGSMKRPERVVYLTLGAALSPLTIRWLESSGARAVPLAHAMVASLVLVALLSNYWALERLRTLWLAARRSR